MKLIIFQLLTNLTIGSIVVFNGKIFKIIDFHITTPFSKSRLIRTTWKNPIHVTLFCKNKYGGVEVLGSKAVKSVYEDNLTYNEITDSL